MPPTLFVDSTPDIDRLWQKVRRPDDIEIAVNMGPVAKGCHSQAGRRLRHGDQRRDLLRAPTLELCRACVTSSSWAPARRASSTSRRRKSSASRSRPSAATATRRWRSMQWAWSSPPPATSRPCTASCAGAVGGRCRASSAGQDVGILGLGGIGREMARLGKRHRLEVVAYDRSPTHVAVRAHGDARRAASVFGHRQPASWPERRDARLPGPDEAARDEARGDHREHRPRRNPRRGGPRRAVEIAPHRTLCDRRLLQGTRTRSSIHCWSWTTSPSRRTPATTPRKQR